MNMNTHASSVAGILRTEIEAWRRANTITCMSREAFAAMVMESHQALGGEAATGVDFTFSGDTYTQAKKAAQKLFRWLDEGCPLPAGIVPSILAALPLDVKLHCLNQMYRPIGVESHSLASVTPAPFNAMHHLQNMIKEGAEAKAALVTASIQQTPEALQHAIKEVSESIEADTAAKRSLEAALLASEYGVEPVSK
ncbi:hypothetical protein [Herbaspirillum sp. SJZ107]|uniref:hypothetical protein n=1 Tax=Herbaspirillum sp. SJZ107 TaxID=2572881 RepID=UPI0011518A57|nr:hypothetical protein [Herbaspirillum sp. SJZ107]TQK10209.1 hypothetical protein FBX97_0125 [Herbaspirillum sp. SJZ107]